MYNEVLISIKFVSLLSQVIVCDDMRLNVEVDYSILRIIATEELTDKDNISHFSSSDDISRLGRHTGSKNKTKLERVVGVVINYGTYSSMVVILK